MPERETVEIREATREDLPALAELYRTVKGRTRPASVTRHRLFDTPWGDSVATVAVADGVCVSLAVYWPAAMRVGSELVVGAQGMEAVTHPGYRGRPRMFINVALAGREITRDRGWEVLYTFPNARSIKLTKHVGGTYLGEVGAWGVAFEHRRLRLPRRRRPTRVSAGEPEVDELRALVAVAHADRDVVRIDKSGTWLSWRYSELTCERYEWLSVRDGAGTLTAAGLLGERDPESWGTDFAGIFRILELFAADALAARELLEGAIEYVRRRGGRKLDLLVKEPVVESVVEQAGFEREAPRPITTYAHGHVRLAVDTLEFSRWRLVSGDHDFF